MLNCAKEDLQLKKKLIDQMDQMDQLHNEHMIKLTTNMENLTNSITSGFALLQNLMYTPPQQHVYQQTAGYGNFSKIAMEYLIAFLTTIMVIQLGHL